MGFPAARPSRLSKVVDDICGDLAEGVRIGGDSMTVETCRRRGDGSLARGGGEVDTCGRVGITGGGGSSSDGSGVN